MAIIFAPGGLTKPPMDSHTLILTPTLLHPHPKDMALTSMAVKDQPQLLFVTGKSAFPALSEVRTYPGVV